MEPILCPNCGKPIHHYSEHRTVIVTRMADENGYPLRGEEHDTACDPMYDGNVWMNCWCGWGQCIRGVFRVSELEPPNPSYPPADTRPPAPDQPAKRE